MRNSFRHVSLLAAMLASSALLASAAMAADAAPDTGMMLDAVKASGLGCDIGKAAMEENNDQHWVVEFRCASQDDGRIGVFPKAAGSTPIIYDCVTAKLAGMACSDTKETAAYPALQADIHKYNVSLDCRPQSTKFLGTLKGGASAYLEVQCDDRKINDQVVQFNTKTLAPMAEFDCAILESDPTIGVTCKIPGAVVNHSAAPNNSEAGEFGSAGTAATIKPRF